MSVRDYAVLWLGAKKGVGGATALGGNVLLTTPTHHLDGPEHLTAADTTTLDATVTEHGLLPKLSGDATDFLDGTGGWSNPGGATGLDDLSDVVITAADDADRLRFDGTNWVNTDLVWEPMMASDGSVMTDGSLNPMMHEVPY